MSKRELQSDSYRLGTDKFKFTADEDYIGQQLPPDQLLDFGFGIGIGVPEHRWYIRADETTGRLGVYSGGLFGPAPFQIYPGAKDGLLVLTEDDKFSWDGNINVTGNYYINDVLLYDLIWDFVKGIDWQDSVKRIENFVDIDVPVQEGDRYIAETTADGWTKDHVYERKSGQWEEIIPNLGYAVWLEDQEKQMLWNGTGWVLFGSSIHHNNLLGIQGGVSNTEHYHLQESAYNNLLSQNQEVYTTSTPSFTGLVSTSDVSITGLLSITGNVDASGTVYANAFSSSSPLLLQTADVTRIEVSDLTGHIDIKGTYALRIPAGTTGERPGVPVQGDIRYNQTLVTFEGYSGLAWGSLGGIIDTDRDTYITAEEGADDDHLRMYTAGSERVTIDKTGKVGIKTNAPGYDLEVAGTIKSDDIKSTTGTITTLDSTTINTTDITATNLVTASGTDSDDWADAYAKRVDTWGDGLSYAAQTASVNVDGSSLEIVSDALQVKPSGILDQHIAWGSGVDEIDTSDMPEGSNLYYTNERVDDRANDLIQDGTGISWAYDDGANSLTPTISLVPFDTGDLTEGIRLYYTDERVDDRVSVLIQDGTGITWSYVDGSDTLTPTITLAPFDTGDLTEGVRLYYTDARVKTKVQNNEVYNISGTWTYTNNVVQSTVTPTSDSHLVRKDYVDGLIQGLDWQESVLSITDNGSAVQTTDNRYIASQTSGGWTINKIYEWNGSSWDETSPTEGYAAWVEDEDVQYNWNGSAWVKFGSTVTHNNLSGKQGGTASEYFHLTSSEYTELSDWIDDVTLSPNGQMVIPSGSITASGVLSTDDVGIYTATPTEALHVVGNIRMVDGAEASGSIMVSDANGVGSWANMSSIAGPWTEASGLLYPDDLSWKVGIQKNNPAEALDVNGNIAVTGTVDGRDVSADGSKLDGIEALADVTDSVNVNSAGAVMETDYNATTFMYATLDDTPQPKNVAEVRTVLSITNVEDTALSIWAGTANLLHSNITAGTGNDHTLLSATAGTSSASKALIVDGNKDLDLVDGDISATTGGVVRSGIKILKPHEQAVPNMTVYVEAGVLVQSDGLAKIVFAGGSSPSFTAPAANPKIDLLVINDAGALVIVTGVEAAVPSPPSYPTDKLPIAEIALSVAQTTIVDANITDVRPFLNLGGGGGGSASILYEEHYVVGTALDNYSGSTTVFDLLNNYQTDGKTIAVFVDGVKMRPGASYDYVETDMNTVTFNYALVATQTVTFRWELALSGAAIVEENRENFTASASQTLFSLAGTYTVGGENLKVYVDGILMTPTDDYTETTTSSVTFITGMTGGEKVTFLFDKPSVDDVGVTERIERYVVGSASGNYSGSLSVYDLLGTYQTDGTNMKVYYDGVLMDEGSGNDYVETDEDTITFNYNLVATHIVTFRWLQYGVNALMVEEKRENHTATPAQTVFNLTYTYITDNTNLKVYVGGLLMRPGTDYTETDSDTVTFTNAMIGGEYVTFTHAIAAAGNATTVNGIAAARNPEPNKLYPLDSNAMVPSAVIGNLISRVGCSVTLSGNQTVSNTTTEQIEFDTEVYDIGDDFNTGTYEFTCPVDGYYIIIFTGEMDVNDTHYLRLTIRKNGAVTLNTNRIVIGGTDALKYTVSTIAKCVATDTIDFTVYHNYGADRPFEAASNAQIHLLGIT